MRSTVLVLLAITLGASADDCKGQARFDKIMCAGILSPPLLPKPLECTMSWQTGQSQEEMVRNNIRQALVHLSIVVAAMLLQPVPHSD